MCVWVRAVGAGDTPLSEYAVHCSEMAETFYSVLGVQPDADRETVERAYRERVKESHPDVSDDPDAPREFARLTVARDILVDDETRERYDRLGHTAYVRAHVDASAWTAEDRDADTDGTAGDRTAAATAGTGATAGGRAATTPTGGGTARQGGGRTVTGETRETAASGRPGTGGGERRRRHQRGTAAAYHRVDPDVRGRERDPLWRRLAAVGRRVGPWAIVHLVLVASAGATAWFGYAGATRLEMSLPALAVAGVVLTTTVLASAVHLLSRVYA
ncbi:MAG: curved DNA-binding protein CbpA [Salinirussus sp.]|jgi:curved DNA-binding protein CbpA